MKFNHSLSKALLACFVIFFSAHAGTAPRTKSAVRTAKARIAVFKESIQKEGSEFIIKRDKICDEVKTINVQDLTGIPTPDYRGTWQELCRASVDRMLGKISYSSDIIVSNLDLFLDGRTTVYRNLFFNFGWGTAGSTFEILGSNSTYEQDLAQPKKLTLKVNGHGPSTMKEKLSVFIEVED